MKIHLIAIGGAAMHNVALALQEKGHAVTGSDDEIFEPSRSRLRAKGLLPPEQGWFPERITPDTDAAIIGMHAREDNPEIARCRELGIRLYSFPEFFYEQTKDKKRLVIGGSHGKTSITAIVLHVLKAEGIKFDYLVGSTIPGFEAMAGLSDESEIAVFEGDEYLSSPLDKRPKFHLYRPHVGVVTGISWDHINVFPTFEEYTRQFEIFAQLIPADGKLFYFEADVVLKEIVKNLPVKSVAYPYREHPYLSENGQTFLVHNEEIFPVQLFGLHNLQNIMAAKLLCTEAGVEEENFYHHLKSFRGAARRLEGVAEGNDITVYYDFAHAPSKVKATLEAVKAKYADKKVMACLELHTFSSLNKNFIGQYKDTLQAADLASVYYSYHTLRHKKLPEIHPPEVIEAFDRSDLNVFTESKAFESWVRSNVQPGTVLLLMSSGNFGGLDILSLAQELVANPR